MITKLVSGTGKGPRWGVKPLSLSTQGQYLTPKLSPPIITNKGYLWKCTTLISLKLVSEYHCSCAIKRIKQYVITPFSRYIEPIWIVKLTKMYQEPL